jgi:hypothetical protein
MLLGGGGAEQPGIFTGSRGFSIGGETSSSPQSYPASIGGNIDYFTIQTTGNASDFGRLYQYRKERPGAASDGNRGVIGGGYKYYYPGPSWGTYTNNIEYITCATTGNGTNFGGLTESRSQTAAASNGTSAMWAGGNTGGSPHTTNRMDRVTIQTTGGATDTGDLRNSNGQQLSAACSDGVKGYWGGGSHSQGGYGFLSGIYVVSISVGGDTSQYGSLTAARRRQGSASSLTRGLWAGGTYITVGGGWTYNSIDYVTIGGASGNASSFGSLNSGSNQYSNGTLAACSDTSRACFLGGSNKDTKIDYVTIASTGNATDFGDLYQGTEYNCSLSGVT